MFSQVQEEAARQQAPHTAVGYGKGVPPNVMAPPMQRPMGPMGPGPGGPMGPSAQLLPTMDNWNAK